MRVNGGDPTTSMLPTHTPTSGVRRDRPHRSAATTRTATADVATWRADIIQEFRLRGAERCAAASPMPGFPQILDSILGVLASAPEGPWIDASADLGGTASWIERTMRRQVELFDSSPPRLRSARRLFPHLAVACAHASRLPVRNGGVSVVIVGNLVSLFDEVDPMLHEAHRILSDGGLVAVTDLWAVDAATRRVGPRTFHSLEGFRERAERHSLDVVHVAVADLSTGWWSSAAAQVDEEIRLRFGHRPGFPDWARDQDRLAGALDEDLLVAAGLVLVRRDDSQPAGDRRVSNPHR
ncbi:MAG: class I SAM-dependent methyltransferase [Ilumatobacter sp.]|uniref:class I SAM-dependent methyltransferase n=1 Tax=Ilumatobacter sp. TaxID=1967498 RepID=UPI003297ADF5